MMTKRKRKNEGKEGAGGDVEREASSGSNIRITACKTKALPGESETGVATTRRRREKGEERKKGKEGKDDRRKKKKNEMWKKRRRERVKQEARSV